MGRTSTNCRVDNLIYWIYYIEMKRELVFLNYAAVDFKADVNTIPTLVPNEKMKSILDGDEDPYYKVESIEYPIQGTGGIYTEQFFDSFMGVMNDRPIPGSKRGHTWDSRPTSDLYTVGAKMDKNGDGTGVIHMKVYIPENGDSDSNTGLIRDAKANIVHFSLVTWPEYTVTKDDEGNEVTYFTASKGYERNDAVEYGAGAMKQTVNSLDSEDFFEKAKSLIEDGKYDVHKKSSTNQPIQNGVVLRSVLRQMTFQANAEDRKVLSSLISMIDKQKNKGVSKVEKSEILDAAKVAKANNSLTLSEVAEAMDMKDQVVTNEHTEALKVLNAFKELGINDPVKAYNSMKDAVDKTAKDRVENKIKAEFDPDGLGEKNLLFVHAKSQLGNKSEAELDEAIKNFKEDPIAKKLAGEMANTTSNANVIGVIEDGGDTGAIENRSSLVM